MKSNSTRDIVLINWCYYNNIYIVGTGCSKLKDSFKFTYGKLIFNKIRILYLNGLLLALFVHVTKFLCITTFYNFFYNDHYF